MKITAGRCRGMTVIAPKGVKTRPTGAKVRAAVMNMLQPYLPDAVFVDLFAGSGAMGLEALSRGAKACYFVEEDRGALATLRQNVQEFERRLQAQSLAPASIQVHSRSVKDAWSLLRRGPRADIVWADPPYQDVLAWLRAGLGDQLHDVTSEGSLFVVEAPRSVCAELTLVAPAHQEATWVKLRERIYGETAIILWQREEGTQHDAENSSLSRDL